MTGLVQETPQENPSSVRASTPSPAWNRHWIAGQNSSLEGQWGRCVLSERQGEGCNLRGSQSGSVCDRMWLQGEAKPEVVEGTLEVRSPSEARSSRRPPWGCREAVLSGHHDHSCHFILTTAIG